MLCKHVARFVLGAAASLALPSLATAHAYLAASDPAAGATLVRAPNAVRLTFTEGIEPAFSTIELRRGNQVVPVGPLATTDRVHVTLPLRGKLAPGTYTVRWHVTAVDTHRTAGSFTFVIRE